LYSQSGSLTSSKVNNREKKVLFKSDHSRTDDAWLSGYRQIGSDSMRMLTPIVSDEKEVLEDCPDGSTRNSELNRFVANFRVTDHSFGVVPGQFCAACDWA
jgi:hypothetical protein